MTASVFGLTATTFADTLQVPAQYATIQAAINASADGDDVLVAPGTYFEAISLQGKAITLHSADGANSTIIDSSGKNTSTVKVMSGEGHDTVIEGFTIAGGVGDSSIYGMPIGGGMNVFATSPTVRDCVFEDNVANMGGGMNVTGGNAIIERCMFRNNRSMGFGNFATGGGGISLNNSLAMVVNCTFEANYAWMEGGGAVILFGTPTFANCAFIGNEASSFGGAVQNGVSNSKFVNCTFVRNDAFQGDALRNWSTGGAMNITVENCIFWGHQANSIMDLGGAASMVRHSVVEFGWNGAGEMILDADPKFGRMPSAGPDDEWGSADDDFGDLCLQPSSSAIDAGDADAIPADVTTDLLGNDRIINGWVDMGAHEFLAAVIDDEPHACPADVYPAGGDGFVNVDDILSILNNFGAVSPGEGGDISPAGGNGAVNYDDLLMAINSFGQCG
jgi:hypothetical protein